jgi:hypothetical protein
LQLLIRVVVSIGVGVEKKTKKSMFIAMTLVMKTTMMMMMGTCDIRMHHSLEKKKPRKPTLTHGGQ